MEYKYKRSILFIFIIFYAIVCQSQEIFVPYRVGDKFGISDEKGKVVLKPSFDILEPGYGDVPYFIGYNFKDDKVVSSFIYKNKLLLSNQPYNNYHVKGNLIIGISYKVFGNPTYSSKFLSIYDIYDLKGKKILEGNYENIFVIDSFKESKVPDDVLIVATDNQNKTSLYIYNNKIKKLKKTVFEKSEYFDIRYNYEYNFSDKSITILYDNQNGEAKKINIAQEDRTLKVNDLGTEQIITHYNGDTNRTGSDMVPEIQGRFEKRIIPIVATDTISQRIRKITIIGSKIYNDKKIEEVALSFKSLETSGYYIIKRNNHKGMQNEEGKIIIPIAYDDIYAADFNGFVLKKDHKYGLYLFRFPNSKIIEPVFEMTPLIYQLSVFNKDFILIKLYDSEGKFFCYANESGMLYYQK